MQNIVIQAIVSCQWILNGLNFSDQSYARSSSSSIYSRLPSLHPPRKFPLPLNLSLCHPTTPTLNYRLSVQPKTVGQKGQSLAICHPLSTEHTIAISTFLSNEKTGLKHTSRTVYCLKYSQSAGQNRTIRRQFLWETSSKALSASLRVYLSFIRPLLEYACSVLHSQLSNELSDKIESVQKHSLRIIYKEGKIPYSFLLKAAPITTLKERRE